MMRSLIATFALLLATCIALVKAHSYHLGACPVVEPMPGFDMNRFLGIWYVIQKTSTASKCISYNFTRGEEPGMYSITQDSDIPVIGLTPLKHEYHYTGELTVPEPSTPARMVVKFPLSVAGSSSYVVFASDYENYAGLFSCQKLTFAHRQSATLLSRRKELDKAYLDKLRQKLVQFGVDPFDLSIVSQSACPSKDSHKTLDLNVDPNTFSAKNIGEQVRKAGEKIGDGIEWLGKTGSKVYHKIAGDTQESKEQQQQQPGNPDVTVHHPKDPIEETNDVEWILK